MKIGKYTLILLLLTFSLLANTKMVGHFRMVDLVIILYIVTNFRHLSLNRNEVALISAFLLVISLTSVFNFDKNPRVHELVFYYKYLFFFLILILIRNLTKAQRTSLNTPKHTDKISPIFFIRFLGFYYIIFNFLFFFNNTFLTLSGASRVSIPFSTLDVGTSNAPAYSVILFAIAIYFDRFRKSRLDSIISFGLIISALLAGSRSGVVIYVLYVIFYRRPVFDKNSISVILICIVGMILYGDRISGLFLELVSRTFEFNLVSDTSAQDRLFKQLLAIEMTLEKSAMFFGIGHENTSITWYDGMVGNLLIIGGAPAVLIFSMVIYVTCKSIDDGPKMFVILFTAVSLISEFVLTSFVCGILLLLTLCTEENNAAKPI
jgi:hypothetical protein